MKGDGERIMVSAMDKVPFNHITRYRWAIREMMERGCKTAIDAACGIGYGSFIAANKGMAVLAIDRCEDARPYQKLFGHHSVTFKVADCAEVELPKADCAFTIETVEHLDDDEAWLTKLRQSCKFLAATVPNEVVVHFNPQKHKFHKRHYTKAQFEDLLLRCGWHPISWATQYEKWDRSKAVMRPGDDGMTLGVICQ